MKKDRAPNFRRKVNRATPSASPRGNTGKQGEAIRTELETDLGETTDVAADQPEVVAIGNVA